MLISHLDPSYAEICDAITAHLKMSKVPRVPSSIMKAASWAGNAGSAVIKKPLPYNSTVHTQLTKSLTFSSEAAKDQGWNPNSVLANIHNWLV